MSSEAGQAALHNSAAVRTAYSPQLKACGHVCCPSSVPACCACADLRPVLDGDLYVCYVDGEGWMNNEKRDAGYCPVCNPKNYEVWERRLAVEREQKEEKRRVQARKEQEAAKVKEEDRKRAAAILTATITTTATDSATASTAAADSPVSSISTAPTCPLTQNQQFTYSNGDLYTGDMNSQGLPHGVGTMIYATGEEYVGQWREGKHHGVGDKSWGDGITYSGEWEDDMMHGRGHYVMADGTEVMGTFAQDEFVE